MVKPDFTVRGNPSRGRSLRKEDKAGSGPSRVHEAKVLQAQEAGDSQGA